MKKTYLCLIILTTFIWLMLPFVFSSVFYYILDNGIDTDLLSYEGSRNEAFKELRDDSNGEVNLISVDHLFLPKYLLESHFLFPDIEDGQRYRYISKNQILRDQIFLSVKELMDKKSFFGVDSIFKLPIKQFYVKSRELVKYLRTNPYDEYHKISYKSWLMSPLETSLLMIEVIFYEKVIQRIKEYGAIKGFLVRGEELLILTKREDIYLLVMNEKLFFEVLITSQNKSKLNEIEDERLKSVRINVKEKDEVAIENLNLYQELSRKEKKNPENWIYYFEYYKNEFSKREIFNKIFEYGADIDDFLVLKDFFIKLPTIENKHPKEAKIEKVSEEEIIQKENDDAKLKDIRRDDRIYVR